MHCASIIVLFSVDTMYPVYYHALVSEDIVGLHQTRSQWPESVVGGHSPYTLAAQESHDGKSAGKEHNDICYGEVQRKFKGHPKTADTSTWT